MGWSAEAQVQAISSWSKLVASIWSKGAYLVLAAVAPYERHSLVGIGQQRRSEQREGKEQSHGVSPRECDIAIV